MVLSGSPARRAMEGTGDQNGAYELNRAPSGVATICLGLKPGRSLNYDMILYRR
jgi:hypothetical protein